jgi:NifU-like protein involved in Fe-S cluster formation
MSNSNSYNPDLDWTQVRETSKMLILSAIQVEDMLNTADISVNTLTESFTAIVDNMHAINEHLLALDNCKVREEALARCSETTDKIQSSIIAFQFYDRMQQCLQHVTSNLKGLSELVESPERLYNPTEWRRFQTLIRARYTMESEKLMFDAIVQGKSIDEALAIKNTHQEEDESDNIELF